MGRGVKATNHLTLALDPIALGRYPDSSIGRALIEAFGTPEKKGICNYFDDCSCKSANENALCEKLLWAASGRGEPRLEVYCSFEIGLLHAHVRPSGGLEHFFAGHPDCQQQTFSLGLLTPEAVVEHVRALLANAATA